MTRPRGATAGGTAWPHSMWPEGLQILAPSMPINGLDFKGIASLARFASLCASPRQGA